MGEFIAGQALLINAVGLHARPSVKLTQLAKTFASIVEIATSAEGPWVDAKSPVKVMRVRAPSGTTLHVRASGADAEAARDAMVALILRRFDEAEGAEHGAGHSAGGLGRGGHG
jgi:phosphocarrier protein HPr